MKLTASDLTGTTADLFHLFEVVNQADITLDFVIDTQVDPAEFRVVVSDTLGQEFLALSKPADDPLTLGDISEIFDRLGYSTTHTIVS